MNSTWRPSGRNLGQRYEIFLLLRDRVWSAPRACRRPLVRDQAAIRLRRVHDVVLASPRTAAQVGDVRNGPRRAPRGIHAPQSAPREKANQSAVRRPERRPSAMSEPAGLGCKSNAFSDRTKRREPDPSMTRKATARPSGEATGMAAIAAPGGAAIDNANVDIVAVGRRAPATQSPRQRPSSQ